MWISVSSSREYPKVRTREDIHVSPVFIELTTWHLLFRRRRSLYMRWGLFICHVILHFEIDWVRYSPASFHFAKRLSRHSIIASCTLASSMFIKRIPDI